MSTVPANVWKIARWMLTVIEKKKKKKQRRITAILGNKKIKKPNIVLARRITRKMKTKVTTMRTSTVMVTYRSQTTTLQSPSAIIGRYLQILRKHGVAGMRGVASKAAAKEEGLKRWIPFDIMASCILPRLPVKSLGRFRCVSKQWCSLFCDQNFAMEQLNKAPETSISLIPYSATMTGTEKLPLYNIARINGTFEVQDRSYGFKFQDMKSYTLSNAVNGLVCAFYGNYRPAEYGYPYLFNPTTRQVVQLPRIKNAVACYDILDCEFLALGFDDTNGVYKVVRSQRRVPKGCYLEVLTVGTQEWRHVGEAPCALLRNPVLFLNGALHWLVFEYENDSKRHLAMMAFDIKEERLRFIPVPKILSKLRNTGLTVLLALQKLEGHLCLVCNPIPPGPHPCQAPPSHPPVLKIWKLNNYVKLEWKREHAIKLPSWAEGLEMYQYKTHVIDIIDGKVLMTHMTGAMYSYDIQKGTFHHLFGEHYLRWLNVFRESLISPSSLVVP